MTPRGSQAGEAHVAWDRRLDRPGIILWRGQALKVVDLESFRDERAAFPADRGPRVTYRVRVAGGQRVALVFDGRRRKWFLDAVEAA
jgi:hypothetical protein